MNDNDIFVAIKESLKSELEICANEEITKLIDEFIATMEKRKAELIAVLINSIECIAKRDCYGNDITFQIVIKRKEA